MPERPMPADPGASQPAAAIHPLLHAGKSLLLDLLSTLVFAALYSTTHNIYLAVALGIAVSVVQVAYLKVHRRPIDRMQWLSLFLVVVFGGATLLAHDPTFAMLKPTFIYAAVGVVMLKPGWMNRYLPPLAQQHGADVSTIFGYLWAALMFGTSAANLALALLASPAIWAWFIGTFPLASKLVLMVLQYLVTRTIVRRRIQASRTSALSIPQQNDRTAASPPIAAGTG